MGAKDTKAKEYLSDNERFADLCNVVLFDGEQVVKADLLEEKDTTEVLSVFGTDRKEMQMQRWRDLFKSVVMKSIGDAYVVLIGVENQSDIHYAMAVKNMLYDAISYSVQVNATAKRHRKKQDRGTSAEFLSGFYKDDRLMPVITITVYWGAEKWDGARNLYDMFENVDERLKKFILDYHINLVAPLEIDDFGKFRTSLGEVLEVIRYSKDRRAMSDLLAGNPKFRVMDNESVSAINTFIGTNIPINEKGSVTDMCKAWEDQRMDGLLAGRKEGREEGREEGRILQLIDLVKDGILDEDTAQQRSGLSKEEFKKRLYQKV